MGILDRVRGLLRAGLPVYLDSWWEPTIAQFRWAKASGFAGWLGYFSDVSGDRIYHGWANQTFLNAIAEGLQTGDYDSGFDNPAEIAARNAELDIIGILDAEASIRPDGPWLDPWMDTAGPRERLYGGGDVMAGHATHGHPGYILAGYPSNSGTAHPIDPGLTFGTIVLPSPRRPIGRQYAGGVPTAYGPVDYSHFEPGFFSGATPQPEPFSMSGQYQGSTTIEHDVYVSQGDGHVHHIYRDTAPGAAHGPDWADEDLGAPPSPPAEQPHVTMDAAVTIQSVSVLCQNGRIYRRYATGTPLRWADWGQDNGVAALAQVFAGSSPTAVPAHKHAIDAATTGPAE